MEIQYSKKFCIITPLSPKLDEREVKRIVSQIQSTGAGQTIGIDLSFVQDCTTDFIYFVKKFKAGLFNIPSDIFTLMTLTGMDKFINLYVSKEDFLEGKHRLLNRKFYLV